MNALKITCLLMTIVSSLCAMAYKRDSSYLEARRHGAMTRIVLHVFDDQGEPVSETNVRVRMGMTFAEKSYTISGVTDTNGLFVIEGITTGNEIGIMLSKAGCYSSIKKLCYIKLGGERDVKASRWQPWGFDECIVIRKIESPINMRNFCGFLDVPVTNQWLGLDLEKGSWLEPYGKGRVADMEVLVNWDGLPKTLSKVCMMSVRSVSSDGGCFFPKIKDSAFQNVKKADSDVVYKPILFECVERINGERRQEDSRWETHSLVMRTRCLKDDSTGHIVTCNYLNLYKMRVAPSQRGYAVMNLEYVFNQKANDPNLEDVSVSRKEGIWQDLQ